MNLVLLGAPGAGKGTQANIIMQSEGLCALSTGNLLREVAKEDSEKGREIKAILESGAFVSDEIVLDLLKRKLASPECAKGVIFDGYPRTVRQAEMLDELTRVDGVIVLDVPDEVIVDRMAQRRTCPKCQMTYHLTTLPPKTEGVCDKCGTELGIRSDDAPEVVLNRLHVYHEKTEPIISYYRASGREFVIDGTQAPDKVSSDVLAVVEGMK
ncbi:MAG: adenylate kinase [Clostridia bacterium]|nr:adenylate kinase [Clostridia bacterium]